MLVIIKTVDSLDFDHHPNCTHTDLHQRARKKYQMSNQTLFTPYTLGDLTLSNRVVLAPLTRNRAGAGFVPSEFAATYYSQRASAGLLISEATQISRQGQGYQDTPGIYTPAQIDAGAR